MSRTLPTTVTAAIASDATRPIYLVEMAFDVTSRAATWDTGINWGGYAWAASGIQIKGLSASGARMVMPTGEDDPWLALVLNEGTRDRAINIYEHHTDATSSPQSDAVLVFTGIMDAVSIADKITVTLIESSRSKTFPALSVDQPTFTYLMTSGDTIVWGSDVIMVN